MERVDINDLLVISVNLIAGSFKLDQKPGLSDRLGRGLGPKILLLGIVIVWPFGTIFESCFKQLDCGIMICQQRPLKIISVNGSRIKGIDKACILYLFCQLPFVIIR